MANSILKWLGLIFAISGAILTSINYFPFNIYCFNLGNLFYLAWSIRIRDANLIIVNGAMLVIYFVGVLKNLEIM